MKRKKKVCRNCGEVYYEASDNNLCFECRRRIRYAPSGVVLHGCGI